MVANLPMVLIQGEMQDLNWSLPRNILGKVAVTQYFSVFYQGIMYIFPVSEKTAAIAAFAADPQFTGWVSLNGADNSRLALSQGDTPTAPVTYAPVNLPQGPGYINIPDTPITSDNYYSVYSTWGTNQLELNPQAVPAVPAGYACTMEILWDQPNGSLVNLLGSSGIEWANGTVPTPTPQSGSSPTIRDLIVLYWDKDGKVLGNYINNFIG